MLTGGRDLAPRPARGSHFGSLPSTPVGRLAGWFCVAFAALLAVWGAASKVHVTAAMAVSLGALRLAGLCGAVAVVLALTALLARGERSWFVWLGLVPGVLLLVVAGLELFWME